jgi:alpha-mannosidase
MGDWREGDVILEAYKFNIPAKALSGAKAKDSSSLVRLEGKGAVIEALKPAEDGNGAVLRLYECFGGRRNIKLRPGFEFKKAYIVNVLEEELESLPVTDGTLELSLKPYQILSIKFI